ncbi:nucleophile aminohydrolase [Pelagophyceae sp. CCMP2097]|nr:nucleophile aminohydrolase [Pelagophyceae sp. CCMP2097]
MRPSRFLLCLFAAGLRGAAAKFSPYANNGGSVVAVAGCDFAIIAADAQLLDGTLIRTEGFDRVALVSAKACVASAGCEVDCSHVQHLLRDAGLRYGERGGGGALAAPACAQLLSRVLYSKRSMPYYAANVVAGVSRQGRGVAYAFDSLGSASEACALAAGAAQTMLQPVLDDLAPQRLPHHQAAYPVFDDVATARSAVLSAFSAAAQRDVTVGATVHMAVITASGVKREVHTIPAAAAARPRGPPPGARPQSRGSPPLPVDDAARRAFSIFTTASAAPPPR